MYYLIPFLLSIWKREGEVAKKTRSKKFLTSLYQSPRDFRTAVAMESVETPVKDGIIYQQHMKFGKVGTPGCQPWAEEGNPCLATQLI